MPETTPFRRRSILHTALTELAQDQGSATVTLREKDFTGRMVLRALDDIYDEMQALLGIALPVKPNTISQSEQITVFWLRERQWLIVTKPDYYEEYLRQIQNLLQDKDSSLVDLSDGYTALELSGSMARDVIMKGCPLDIHPGVFPPGSMAQTRIVHADILLHYVEENVYNLYIRNSFAEYLLRWLTDAALEYGIHVKKENAS